MERNLQRKLKAQLYLRAVLPAFEELLEKSELARAALGERAFSICFQVGSRLKTVLDFREGRCRWLRKGRARDADVILHFVTEAQLNKEFEKTGFSLPIPLKGQTRIKDILVFKELTALFEGYMRGDAAMEADPSFESLMTGMQLGIALRATKVLVQHEPVSKMILRDAPEGLAYFSVGEDGYGAWLEWSQGVLESGTGAPERRADALIEFADPKTALQVVGNRIDVMAAVGLGDIRVRGLIPLADALGYVFERIPLYISP